MIVKTEWIWGFLICLAISSCSRRSNEVSFMAVDPYTKVFPENTAFCPVTDTVEIAAGEHAIYQFAVHSPFEMREVNLSSNRLKNEVGDEICNISVKFVGYVGVGTPADQRPHDALNSTTGLYPDPLLGETCLDIPCGQTTPVWVTVTTNKDTKPGLYKSVIQMRGKVHGKSFVREQPILLRVYPVILDEPSFWSQNWYADDKLKVFCNNREEKCYSDAYWQMLKSLAVKMKEVYQNVAIVNALDHVVFAQEGKKYSFDFTRYDQVLDIFIEAGIDKMIVGNHFCDRASNIWTSDYALYVPEMNNGKMVKNLYSLQDEKTQNFYKQFIPALMTHLKEKGLKGKYYQHIADEPIDENSQSYIAIAKFIKSLAPGLKVIDACQSAKLSEVIDVWIPIINAYQNNYEFFRERQKKGNEVWFYTCCFPRGEYANRMIEWPLVKTRLIYWIAFNYGATGYLHWGFNYWTDDPYKETTLVDSYGTTLPAGDCFIVYPDYKGGLNGSIRLEAIRQGIEDYTLLKMLEKKNANLVHDLSKTVIKDWNSYNTDVNYLKRVRRTVLEELSKK